MKRYVSASLIGLGASLMFSAPSFGQVIGNWENGSTDGWIDWSFANEGFEPANGGPGTILPAPSYAYSTTEGVTLGSESLAFDPASPVSQYGSGYYQALSNKLEYNGEVGDFTSNSIFSIDVTFDASKLAGASYANFNLIVNGPGWGFNTLPSSTMSDTANPGDPGGWDPTDFPGVTTRTISWNYSAALAAMGANPGYVEMILVSSTNASNTTAYGEYFDNARFTSVPEPASVGLVGMTGVGLLLRRRRSH